MNIFSFYKNSRFSATYQYQARTAPGAAWLLQGYNIHYTVYIRNYTGNDPLDWSFGRIWA